MSDSSHIPNNILSRFFDQWARLCFKHAKLVVSISAVVILALGSQALKIKVDISTEAMLRDDDPVRINYQNFRKTFGREDVIILSVPTAGSLNNEFLANIYDLQNEIDLKVPYVQKITSLINARYSYGDDDELIVEELLENYPKHKWDEDSLIKHVLAQKNYINRLVSEDGQFIAIIIELQTYAPGSQVLLTEVQSAETYKALRALLDENIELGIAMSGKPVLLTVTNTLTAQDSAVVGMTVLTMIILFMVFFFRRLSGLLISLAVVYGSILSGVGLMGFFGAPYTMTSNALVPLVLGIGVADIVHILSIFYKRYDESGNKEEAIIIAMGHSAPAVFLTTLTTVIGFLSFVVGDLASTAELGIYAAATVGFALFFTITLAPSLISLFSIKQKTGKQSESLRLIKFLSGCGEIGIKFPRFISIASIILFFICVWGTSLLKMSFDPIEGFSDDLLAKQDNFKIDKQYGGITNFEVIIDSGEPNGIFDEAFVKKLLKAEDQFSNRTIAGMPLGDTYSFLDIVREVNKSLNSNNNDFYTIPQDRQLLAQEVLLFELSQAEDLYDVIDNNKQKVRLTLKTFHADGVEYEVLIRTLEKDLFKIFGADVDIVITGVSALVAESVPKAIKTMSKSYVIAGVLIILILMILLGSFRMGLISILPNLLPIVLTMNIMVLLNWPIDMSTIMVGAIAMGLVVDDSLHFLYQVKNGLADNQDVRTSIRGALTSVGPALVMTTVIFTSSMLVELNSSIFPIFAFGATMAMIAVFALMSDILIAPALLTWVYGGQQEGQEEGQKEGRKESQEKVSRESSGKEGELATEGFLDK